MWVLSGRRRAAHTQHAHRSRLIQYLVHDLLSPNRVGSFLKSLATELEGMNSNVPPLTLSLQNYVVHQLCCLVGPAGLAAFAETYVASAV